MKVYGVEIAPVRIPFHRRLETLAALGWIVTMVVGGTGGWLIWLALFYFFPLLRLPLVLYIGYIFGERGAAEDGRRSG